MKTEKALIVYSFLACLFLMIVGIFSAQTTNQLMSAFIYMPLVFFFGSRLFRLISEAPAKKTDVTVTTASLPVAPSISEAIPSTTTEEESVDVKGVSDKNKRLFLQLIGTTGLSLLLMAIFNRRARDTFLSGGNVPVAEAVSVKDISGNIINPAEKSATDGYHISDIDDKDRTKPAYYSFVKDNGSWYILQNIEGNFRYAKGDANYQTSWEVREKLRYDYYNKVFS